MINQQDPQSSEIFEITDFTTASDWERFINDFEEIIRHWNLSNGQFKAGRDPMKCDEISNGTWHQQIEPIRFSKVPFIAIHYYLVSGDQNQAQSSPSHDESTKGSSVPLMDMMSVENDYPQDSPIISRFYGLREFILIAPDAPPAASSHNPLKIPTADPNIVSSEDRIKLLVSSCTIALGNTSSEVPTFIQINQKSSKLFHGVFTTNDVRINYDMIYLKEFPSNYRYLSELIAIFKEKIGSSDIPPVNISIRFTNILKKIPSDALFYDDPIDINEDVPIDVSRMIDFVAYSEPLSEIQLCHSWKSLSEELITDSPFHSDLNYHEAPFWSIRISSSNDFKSSLSDLLTKFLNLTRSRSKDQQILTQLMQESEDRETDLEVKSALDRLTNPSLSLNIPLNFKMTRNQNVPQNVVSCLLGYIFESPFGSDGLNESMDQKKMRKILDESGFILKDFKAFKSAPFDSICWRMIHVLAFVNSATESPLTLAIFWKEIINELRNFWESSQCLPGMTIDDDGPPDQATCLFNQKLQMLNCCIKQKIKYESRAIGKSSPVKKSAEEDDEDLFYDAESDHEGNDLFICLILIWISHLLFIE